jgi:hypothetical protein
MTQNPRQSLDIRAEPRFTISVPPPKSRHLRPLSSVNHHSCHDILNRPLSDTEFGDTTKLGQANLSVPARSIIRLLNQFRGSTSNMATFDSRFVRTFSDGR